MDEDLFHPRGDAVSGVMVRGHEQSAINSEQGGMGDSRRKLGEEQVTPNPRVKPSFIFQS